MSNIIEFLERQTSLQDFNCCENQVGSDVLLQLLTVLENRALQTLVRLYLQGCDWESDEAVCKLGKIVAEGPKVEYCFVDN